jgi:ribosome-associated toxin RatA of RatAB toxin-antitoxin module
VIVRVAHVAFLAAAALILAGAPAARAQSGISVQAQRSGGAIELKAEATIEAGAALVWRVISDYENLPQFVPGLTRSVIVSRKGNRLVVEQSGEAGFLFFRVPIEVRLEVDESPPDRISSRAVGGNLRRMTGLYEIRAGAAPGEVILRYAGMIEPGFNLPPIFGMAALQSNVEEQFEAMVREIRRRAAER